MAVNGVPPLPQDCPSHNLGSKSEFPVGFIRPTLKFAGLLKGALEVHMVYESAEQLEEACLWWQHALRIRDWDIRPELVRGYDLGDKLANADIHLEGCRATVKLVEWGDIEPYLKADEAFADMEQSLVHELLHVMFSPFEGKVPDDSLEHEFVEQAINKLAYALVKLKRRGSP